MYEMDGGRFVFYYAWNRPDLGGTLVGPGTAGWNAMKSYHTNPG
jgi:hypothetical protein